MVSQSFEDGNVLAQLVQLVISNVMTSLKDFFIELWVHSLNKFTLEVSLECEILTRASFYLQVRVNALLCFGDLVSTLDKHAVLEILQTIHRCTEVDHSAPTLMCTLGVANSILKQVNSFQKQFLGCFQLSSVCDIYN